MKRISALAISTLLALSIPTAYADECDIPDVYGYDYNYIDCLSEGIAWVRKDGKYGFVDKTGKVVIPLIYDDAYHFYNGEAEVSVDDERFYIDKEGRFLRYAD